MELSFKDSLLSRTWVSDLFHSPLGWAHGQRTDVRRATLGSDAAQEATLVPSHKYPTRCEGLSYPARHTLLPGPVPPGCTRPGTRATVGQYHGVSPHPWEMYSGEPSGNREITQSGKKKKVNATSELK